MRLRDVLVGAGVSLLVAIISGIIVWSLTSEPRTRVAAESLRYQLEDVAGFTLGQSRIGFISLKVKNEGSKIARDVRVVIAFPPGVEIKERQFSLSSGPVGSFKEDQSDPRKLDLSLPGLAPDELLTASLLVNGSSGMKPDVGVRSAETIGVASELEKPKQLSLGGPTIILILFLALLAQTLLAWAARLLLKRMWRWRYAIDTPSSSVNDTGFLYIHQKMIKEARELLGNYVDHNGGDPLTLANYALALGLDGDIDGAEKRFKSAEWWAETSHEKSVVLFNRAILSIGLGAFADAKKYLGEAVRLNRKEIVRYCNFSDYFQDAKNIDAEFNAIIA